MAAVIPFSSPAPPASSVSMWRGGCCRTARAVVGLDNVNDYYDPKLKEARRRARQVRRLRIRQARSRRPRGLAALFERHHFPMSFISRRRPACAIRCRAAAYVDANLVGFINILEGCRHNGCRHLLYASSTSVYGANTHMPFSVTTTSTIRSASTAPPRRPTS